MATVVIDSVSPLDSSLGLPLQTQISVVFNQLMDEDTINGSTFLVSGPDTSTWDTPGVRVINNQSPENVLIDFGGTEYIGGTISFVQVDLGGTPATQAIFTPTTPLAPNTEYVVYLAGDEGDTNVVTPISAIDATSLVGTYIWTFTTGSGSVSDVPDVSSSAVLAPPSVTSSSAILDPFDIESISPANRATNLGIDTDTIIINFNKNVDGSTVDSAITIIAESVNGDTTIPSAGSISFTSSTSGSTVTLTLVTQLLTNNIISITVNNTIKDVDGNQIVLSESEFYFTTTYSPLYVTARRIRLEIGSQLVGVPDDTINFAIFEASRFADAVVYTGSITNSKYFSEIKRNFVVCEASGILLQGISSGGNVSSKSLGDFSVSYDTKYLPNMLDRLTDCVDKWLPLLMSGGDSKDFTRAVKGLYDPNRPALGRMWTTGDAIIPGANSKEAYYLRWKNTWEGR